MNQTVEDLAKMCPLGHLSGQTAAKVSGETELKTWRWIKTYTIWLQLIITFLIDSSLYLFLIN